MRSQTRHQRTQKLTLTRTGGTTHQTVRAVLHQVQRERARIAHTNLSAETISLRPKRLNILSTRRGRQTNQLGQLYQLRQTATQQQTLRVLMMRQSTRHMKSIPSAHTGEHTVSDRVTAARLRIGYRSLLTDFHDRSTRRRKTVNGRSQHNTGDTASARSSSLIRHQTHFIAVRQKVACRRLAALSEGIRINDHAQAAGRKRLNVMVKRAQHLIRLLLTRSKPTHLLVLRHADMRKPRRPHPVLRTRGISADRNRHICRTRMGRRLQY